MLASSGVWADALKGTVAERLRELGVGGMVVQMAERGQLLELEREMPTCYCPKGARHFPVPSEDDPVPGLRTERGSLPEAQDGWRTSRPVECAARARALQPGGFCLA